MKKIRLSLFVIVAALTMVLFTSCNKNYIATPENVTIDIDNNLTWDKVTEAKEYQISIYSVDNLTTVKEKTRKNTYSLSTLEVGDYEIRVKSISGMDKMKDSKFCGVLYFHKYLETGCLYKLINNETEYEVTKYGKATGSITIEDIYRGKAVTSIADNCFKGSTRVTDVIIGNNVTSVGKNGFYNCSKLASVVIPSSVTSLGDSCFQSCRALTSVTIPYSIDVIPQFCFAYCRSLQQVELPDTLTTLSASAFQDCSALCEINIKDNVTSVGEYAFSGCSVLTHATIGKKVASLGERAFYRCSLLATVDFNIPSGLKDVGAYCFSEDTSLATIALPNGVETIGAYAFLECSILNDITIPDTTYSVGAYSFHGTKVYTDAIAAGDDFIYADNWLIACNTTKLQTITAITEQTLLNTIVGIADQVFYGAPNLTQVRLPASFKYIGRYTFGNCTSLWKFTTLDNSIEIIGEYAFANCVLTNVQFGIGLKTIGKYAFVNNAQLDNNSLNPTTWIPESVSKIGTYAFYKTKLWNKPRDNDGIVYAANWVVGFSGSVGSVTLNFDTNRIAGISDYAFYKATSLSSVVNLDKCRYIGKGAFEGCKKLNSVSLNRNITEINDFTFYECTSLIKVTYPRTLKTIGQFAFYGCTSLIGAEMNSTKCELIGKSAFYNCSNLTTLNFSNNLTKIDDYAFYKCTSLKSVEFSSNIKTIGERSFFKNTSLTTVTFNDKLTDIGVGAFNSCTALTAVNLPDSVEVVGKNAFYKCENVESVTFGENLTTIGDYAFFGLSKPTELKFNANLNWIGPYAFKGWLGLTTLYIPQTIKIIGQHAFYGCKNVTIYTDAESILGEWHNRFNSSFRPMFWNCDVDQDGHITAIYTQAEYFSNRTANGDMYGPSFGNVEFDHFVDGENTTYTINDLKNTTYSGKLTVINK